MEWNMLKESKKLYPHWLDKRDNSNFTKHLKILNNQQSDKRHKLKCVEWSRLLNKPLKIHKVQNEPHKWKVEFEANIPRLKEVNIYKNPTVVNNKVINNAKVIDGYLNNNKFYKYLNKEITNLLNEDVDDDDLSYQNSEINVSNRYEDLIYGEEGKFYHDISTNKYYKYENEAYVEVNNKDVPQTSLIHSESFIDNYSHFFRHILYEDNTGEVKIQKYISIEDDVQKYKTNSNGDFELQAIHVNVPQLYFNLTNKKYCFLNDNNIIEVDDDNIIHLDCNIITREIGGDLVTTYDYFYVDSNNKEVHVDLDNVDEDLYYVFTDYDEYNVVSKIPYLVIEDNEIVFLEEEDKKYKIRTNNTDKYIDSDNELSTNIIDNGKLELTLYDGEYLLYYNVSIGSYCILKDNEFVELENVIYLNYDNEEYYYIDENEDIIYVNLDDIKVTSEYINQTSVDNLKNEVFYIITTSTDEQTTKIPLIDTEDITPIISNDRYVLEVFTWDDFHFLKGFPEIDFIDYNNNNIIDEDERTYDNLSIEIEKINDKEYLTFRVHQFGIKLIEIFKDEKPIHEADFVIEKLGYSNKTINNNFAHIYNYNDNQLYTIPKKDTNSIEEIQLDVDEYVYRLPLTEDDKIYDTNGNFELKNKYDLQVTYYTNPLEPLNSEYDKILRKTYVCEDSIFYHDVSLDMIGVLYNVPRHVFRQPYLETYDDQIEYYNNTYPKYCNLLNEDDYHYQKRLEYYINNYNKIYFPCLELWKYFHIDSELINRKVIVAEQNYSYLRNLKPEEDKYINELGTNKAESFYLNEEYNIDEENVVTVKPKLKSIISPYEYEHNINGILIDNDENYIKDINGTPVNIEYVYSIKDTGDYIIHYNTFSKTIYWYNPKKITISENNSFYQIKLTESLSVVPNTRYQLRFCVKKYPTKKLNLKLIYKNRNGNIREVVETTPVRQDYDNEYENNELIYSDYKKEWDVECEYICTDFLTLDDVQNIEVCLESQSQFKISDITLQRITINHFDTEYMKTNTYYNSCVYDLYADYNDIPSNIKYDNLNIFNKILNRSLPLTKTGFFNFAVKNENVGNTMKLTDSTNIYINDMLSFESVLPPQNYATNITQKTFKFNKYIKIGEYQIEFEPYVDGEGIFDMNIDINMIVFTKNNHAVEETLTINNLEEYYDIDKKCFKIPFMNKSDNSFTIKLYREQSFGFKNFKLIRKDPLTVEELTQ